MILNIEKNLYVFNNNSNNKFLLFSIIHKVLFFKDKSCIKYIFNNFIRHINTNLLFISKYFIAIK